MSIKPNEDGGFQFTVTVTKAQLYALQNLFPKNSDYADEKTLWGLLRHPHLRQTRARIAQELWHAATGLPKVEFRDICGPDDNTD